MAVGEYGLRLRTVLGEREHHHEAVAVRHGISDAAVRPAVDAVTDVATRRERVGAAAAADDRDGALQVRAARDGDALIGRATVELHLPQCDVERPSLGLHRLHRHRDVGGDHRRVLGQRVRRADRISGVKGNRVQIAGVATVATAERAEELPPQHRTTRVVVQSTVPVAQYVAAGREVEWLLGNQHHRLLVACLHHGIAQHVGMQGTVAEPRRLQLVAGEQSVIAAQRRIGDQQRVLAGAAGLRHTFGSGERRVAREQFGGVGQPMRVVGVEHVVVAFELRLLIEREDARAGRRRVVDPLVDRIAAVQQDRAVVEHRRGQPAGGDLGLPTANRLRGQIGRGRRVRIPGAAVGGGGDRVHPRDAIGGAMCVDELVHRRRRVHAHELLEDRGVVDVGVAHGEGESVGPAERQVEHRPVVAAVHRARLRRDAAVRLQHVDGDVLRRHLLRLVAVDVARGIAGGERQ